MAAEMMATFALLRKIVEALGLGSRKVCKVILEIEINKPLKVHVTEWVTGNDTLVNLMGEIPTISPFVQFVDRVKVENAAAVEIKQVQCVDDEARELCMQVMQIHQFGSDQDKMALKAALYKPGGLS